MRFILLIVLFFSVKAISAQSWSGVGAGVDDRVRCFYSDSVAGKLYAGGHFYSSNYSPTLNAIGSWNGNQWDSLGEGTVLCSPSGCYPVLTIEKYNGDIYAGGMFYGMQNVMYTRGIAKWNDTTWSSVGDVWGFINDMVVFDSSLYVVGNFDSIDGVFAQNIARYDGISWQAIADTIFSQGMLYTVDVYQGKLFVGGVRYNLSNATACAYNFDGATWADIGSGIFTDTASVIMTMGVYQNEIYAGGTFKVASGAPGENIAKWNGTSWTSVGGGIEDTLNLSVSLLSMCVYNNKLVVGGYFKKAGGVYAHNIALWDGNFWCGLGNPFPVYVEALATFNDTLYAGGGFTSVEGDYTRPYIAKWIAPNNTDTCGITAVAEFSSSPVVVIYPNPANKKITFQFANGENRTIVITDQLGREVWRRESDQVVVEFHAYKFSTGMYFYRVEETGTIKAAGKLIIE